jgi:predicted ester cyclase
MASDRNKEVIRRIYDEGYNRGNETVFDECYDATFVHHSKTVHDFSPGPAGEKESMRRFRSAIPDVWFEVLDLLGDGDLVAARLLITGTPQHDFGTLTATGAAISIHAIALFRFVGGRVGEEWFFTDAAP